MEKGTIEPGKKKPEGWIEENVEEGAKEENGRWRERTHEEKATTGWDENIAGKCGKKEKEGKETERHREQR